MRHPPGRRGAAGRGPVRAVVRVARAPVRRAGAQAAQSARRMRRSPLHRRAPAGCAAAMCGCGTHATPYATHNRKHHPVPPAPRRRRLRAPPTCRPAPSRPSWSAAQTAPAPSARCRSCTWAHGAGCAARGGTSTGAHARMHALASAKLLKRGSSPHQQQPGAPGKPRGKGGARTKRYLTGGPPLSPHSPTPTPPNPQATCTASAARGRWSRCSATSLTGRSCTGASSPESLWTRRRQSTHP